MEGFSIGTKVRVKDFPLPVHQSVAFNWNGLIGVVKAREKVGLGLNNLPVYSYTVFFEEVDVPYANRTADGKIDRGVKKSAAQNQFEEVYLERVG